MSPLFGTLIRLLFWLLGPIVWKKNFNFFLLLYVSPAGQSLFSASMPSMVSFVAIINLSSNCSYLLYGASLFNFKPFSVLHSRNNYLPYLFCCSTDNFALGNLTLPTSLLVIQNDAFSGCSSLRSLVIPT